jgi:hypothetical protein
VTHDNDTDNDTDTGLAERLRVFRAAGLMDAVPTRWQIRQGGLEMTPYVVSTDVTAEEGYRRAPLGHPVLRQPLIFAEIGRDHLRTGSALDARLESVCAHLQLTHHRGMPVFDLQMVQTHAGGLEHLEAELEALLRGVTPAALRRRRRIATLILREPDEYFRRFLGPDGWIARAARLEYPTPRDERSNVPPEFFSLVGFLNYCAAAFPARPRDVAWWRYPRYVARLATRRFREGGGLGWFDRDRAAGVSDSDGGPAHLASSGPPDDYRGGPAHLASSGPPS